MTNLTNEDLTRIAARMRRGADLLEERGPKAVDLARQWAGNLRAGGSNDTGRTSTGDHTDPTGDTAATDVDRDGLFQTRLRSAIDRVSTDVGILTEILATTVPLPKPTTENRAPHGYCQSCYRDAGYLEPEHTHADGRVKHRGSCAWCHGFLTEQKRQPPLELLEKRHRGGRITTLDVQRAMTRKTKRRKGT